MSQTPTPELFFYHHAGLDKTRVRALVDNALKGMDDGELYFQDGVS